MQHIFWCATAAAVSFLIESTIIIYGNGHRGAMYIGGLQNFLSYVNPLNPILTVTKQPILCSSVSLPIAGMNSSRCHIRKAPYIHLSTERWNSSGPRTNPNERAATHSQILGADRHGTDWAGAVKLRRGYPKGNDT